VQYRNNLLRAGFQINCSAFGKGSFPKADFFEPFPFVLKCIFLFLLSKTPQVSVLCAEIEKKPNISRKGATISTPMCYNVFGGRVLFSAKLHKLFSKPTFRVRKTFRRLRDGCSGLRSSVCPQGTAV
jgi:hypothetical protein